MKSAAHYSATQLSEDFSGVFAILSLSSLDRFRGNNLIVTA